MVDRRRPESIVDLAREATQVREPGRALRAIADLRPRLDDLEQFHVDNALARGWSWARIAQSLGISRQAAHKRHAARAGGAHGAQRLTVTEEAQRAVARARREAAERGHRTVGAPHLMLALLDPDAGTAARVLARLGVDAGAIAAELPAPPARRRGTPRISPEVHRAFERSLTEAVQARSGRICPEHLLLALLRQSGGAATRVLAAAGADPRTVESLLLEAPPVLAAVS